MADHKHHIHFAGDFSESELSFKNRRSNTLDSGIDVASEINVAHGTFGKIIKRSH
jgi:hypothetical protein